MKAKVSSDPSSSSADTADRPTPTPSPDGDDGLGGLSMSNAAKSQRLREADNIVKNHIIAVMGASLVPIPLVDLVVLSSVQLKMLRRLSELYEVPFTRNASKQIIAALLGGVIPTSAAITVASFSKVVPGMGTTTGMISVSSLGGAITYAIGQTFIRHFESGGTLLDVDLVRLRRLFRSKVKEGKQTADELRGQKANDNGKRS